MMSRSTNKGKRIDFWACDLETTSTKSQYFKKTGDVVICLVGGIHVKEVDGELIKSPLVYTNDLTQFFNEIINQTKTKTHLLYFHNLGNFDGSYIIDYLLHHDFRLIYDAHRPPKNENWCNFFIADNADVYTIEFSYQGHRFKILDSLKLLTLSIKALGESQGLPKLESDYLYEPVDDVNDYSNDEIRYLERDCEIMIAPLLSFFKHFKTTKMTAGSTAINGLRDHIQDEHGDQTGKRFFNFLTNCDYTTAIEMLPWCFGGLTFYNHQKVLQKVPGVFCYDATSFYPSQMHGKPMIIGSSKRKVEVNEAIGPDEVAIVHIIVLNARFKNKDVDFLFLRNWKKQLNRMDAVRDLSSAGSYVEKIDDAVHAYYFEWELEALKKWYDIEYIVVERFAYLTDYYMRDYIQYLFQMRKKYKARQSPDEITYKTVLNSTFGKCMENPQKREMLYIHDSIDRKPNDHFGDFLLLKKKHDDFKIGEYSAWVAINTKTKDYVRNPIIGAYITALARTEMMNIVFKYRDAVVYGDTDSVFVTQKIPEFEDAPNELGTWKREFLDYPDGFAVFVYGTKRYICYSDKELETLKLGMAGASKVKFKDFIKKQALLERENFNEYINREIANMKLAKRTKHGKKILLEGSYMIRIKEKK